MTASLITWVCIAAFFLLILFIKIFKEMVHSDHKHHLINLGTEREEFFVPGDRLDIDNKDCDDCDDF